MQGRSVVIAGMVVASACTGAPSVEVESRHAIVDVEPSEVVVPDSSAGDSPSVAPDAEEALPTEIVERESAEVCAIGSRVLDTALEAHAAQYGEDISSADDLVTTGLLTEIPNGFTVDVSGDFPIGTVVAGGPCDFDFESATAPRSVDDRLDDELRFCWVDQISVGIAVNAYRTQFATSPTSLDDLVAVDESFVVDRSTVDLDSAGEIIDLVPGGCDIAGNLDVVGPDWVGAPPRCAVDGVTLAFALDFTDRFGDPTVSTEVLVAEGLIDDRPYLYAVVAGAVVDIDASGCPSVDADADEQRETPSDPGSTPVEPTVSVDERATDPVTGVDYTLEVHSDGCGVFRTGEIGDDLTWVVTDADGFQVLGRNAAGETQYRYFRSGTFTVVLESWGGSYYVPVSNEVTIVC